MKFHTSRTLLQKLIYWVDFVAKYGGVKGFFNNVNKLLQDRCFGASLRTIGLDVFLKKSVGANMLHLQKRLLVCGSSIWVLNGWIIHFEVGHHQVAEGGVHRELPDTTTNLTVIHNLVNKPSTKDKI